MTSVKDFAKRVFGTSKIMTAVAVTLIVVGCVMGGIFVAGWASKQQKENAVEQRQASSGSASTTTGGSAASQGAPTKTYTTSEVAQHNTLQDCWMIIGSSVYDLSSFLGQHPGGAQTMLPYCGRDGTQGFATMDRGRGQTHSSSANQLKEDYKIGTVAN